MKLTTVCGVVRMAGLVVAGVLAFSPGQVLAASATTPVLPGILLNEDDNGGHPQAMVGDYLLVALADPWGGANGWEVTEVTGNAVRLIGRSQHMPGPGDWLWGQDKGQPDTADFRFVAVAEGSTTLKLVCNPPRGIMAPARLYEITIRVGP